MDHGPYSIAIAEHVVIPETNDAITFLFDGPSARAVDCLIVLAAIRFDDEPCAVACEIRNEVTDRHLTAEMLFGKTFAQQTPQSAFRVGPFAAQAACTRDCARWRMMLQLPRLTSTITPP